MRYLLPVLLFMLPVSSNAQYICKVYQRIEGMESRKCVVTARYDEAGRLIKEDVNGYNVCLDDINTMYCYREDGNFDYYHDDLVKYKMVITEVDDVSHRPFDSGKVFYYYDSTNTRLVRDLTVKHLNVRKPGKKPGGYRNSITYDYNADGLVSVKNGIYGNNSAEFFGYDQLKRPVYDSICSYNDGFKLVSRYEYTDDGYRLYDWSNDRRYPVITVFRNDDEGRIVEKATWFHKREDIDGGSSAHSFSWKSFLKNDMKQYKLFDKETTEYNDNGRIAKTMYYYGAKHTTTHEFEYEDLHP